MSEHILGISCYYHDAAACLLENGEVVAAAEEERFNREKHYSGFPKQAVRYCLGVGRIIAEQVDYIVFYEKPFIKFNRILETYISLWPRSFGAFGRAIPLWLKRRVNMVEQIAQELNVDKEKIYFGTHHLSHAASAFYLSPFKEAGILTIDGVGEWNTTTVGYGKDNQISIDKVMNFPHSIGLFYSALTSYLGFRVNDAEWKVMGLASYGEPRYFKKFRDLIDIKEDGSFRLDMDYFSFHYSHKKSINRRFEKHFGFPQRQKDEEINQFHTDVAASGQKIVEEVIVKIADTIHESYHTPYLAIAGGVGLNSSANWRIVEKTGIKDIFVQPAAGDSGGAIGAALSFYHLTLGNKKRNQLDHAYLGPSYSNDEIWAILDSYGASYESISDERVLLETTAKMLADNKVVGWYQGRLEFGPRALGNRSILANPTNPDMKDILNEKVKFRESFRPFAPSVTLEDSANYFDIEIESPYMLLIPQVRPEMRAQLPAITHVDGTARIQTVKKEANPLYYRLLCAFKEISGVSVLLNTSFNVRGEPIVSSPRDAYSCYMRTGMDALVIGNFVLTEKDADQKGRFEKLNLEFLCKDEETGKDHSQF